MSWLLAGAVLGVLGYRRLGRLARSIIPAQLTLPGRRQLRGRADRQLTGQAERQLTGQAERQLTGQAERQLTGQAERQLAGQAGRRRAGALPAGRTADVGLAGFLRDVREGMADYLDRQAGRSGSAIAGQQAAAGLRALPGGTPEDGY